MKIVQLKCPSCGAALEAEDNLETFYCKYCGQKIILADQKPAMIGAKMFGKLLEHRERMYEKKAEEERIRREEILREQKRSEKIGIIVFSVISVILIVSILLGKLL